METTIDPPTGASHPNAAAAAPVLPVDRTDLSSQIDDTRIREIEELEPPSELIAELPLDRAVAELVYETRRAVRAILEGTDPRLLVVVGPCSVHDSDAALEYAKWLISMRNAFADTLFLIMRVYIEKPRTRVGWKGMVNDPLLDGSFRIQRGLRTARRLLRDINAMGVPTATEYVDVVTPQYFADLVSWSAIGARTTECQLHRQLASGLSCPVGFKNTTDGNVEVAVNGVMAARRPHRFVAVTKSGRAAVIGTAGNADCHIILRGGVRPNYDARSVASASAILEERGLCPRVMVDCSHGNCEGDYRRQINVARRVHRQVLNGSHQVLGMMVESNLVEGSQPVVPGRPLMFGQSITDPCLGLTDTEILLRTLARRRRAPRREGSRC